MPSSITIPDHLRRKIKRIAALYGASQVEIISIAVEEYDRHHRLLPDITDPELKAYLSRISKKIHKEDPDRKRRYEKLTSLGVDIGDILPSIWGREIEE